MTTRKRNVWGWGYEDAAVDAEARRKLGMLLSTQMDLSALEPLDPPSTLELPPSRLTGDAPCPLSRDAEARAGHPHGLTLRHFPQSFEFSTLGGWLATRAGGHYATLLTHIDDLTESCAW
jgi:hypothetical protein